MITTPTSGIVDPIASQGSWRRASADSASTCHEDRRVEAIDTGMEKSQWFTSDDTVIY
jgi:hypothetical protein